MGHRARLPPLVPCRMLCMRDPILKLRACILQYIQFQFKSSPVPSDFMHCTGSACLHVRNYNWRARSPTAQNFVCVHFSLSLHRSPPWTPQSCCPLLPPPHPHSRWHCLAVRQAMRLQRSRHSTHGHKLTFLCEVGDRCATLRQHIHHPVPPAYQ